MEHNQYLDKILYLIEQNYFDKKINHKDLNKIEQLIYDLNNNKTKSNYKEQLFARNFKFLFKLTDKGALVGDIEEKIYKDYRTNFLASLANTEFDKMFKYPSQLFENFIKEKKNIKVHLIQLETVFDLAFEVAFELGPQYYVYSGKALKKIDIKELNKYKTKFNNDLGVDLDSNLKKLSSSQFENNTRTILIDYATNFNTIVIDDIDSLILEPGIINVSENYANRFTMMMHFITKTGNVLSKPTGGGSLYYDTFCLNPPDNC